jgi:hypothetical protein
LREHSVAERLRQVLAPVVAFLASCLAMTSVVSIPDVHRSVLLLCVVNERWVGWAGLALAGCVAVAGMAVAAAPRLGAAPAVSFGAAAAVFGLALGDGIADDLQVVLAMLALAVAFGALAAGGASVVLGLPRRLALLTAAGWAVPLVAGWPVTVVLELRGEDVGDALALHPPIWLLVVVTGLIVVWSSLAVLLQEYDDRPPGGGDAGEGEWSTAWFVLIGAGGGAGLVMMVLGFDPDASSAWARTTTLLASALVVVALAGAARWLPHPVPQAAYVGSLVVLLLVPSVVQLMVMTTDGGQTRMGGPAVLVLVLGAVAGALLGGWRARVALPLGLLVTAGGAAGVWVLPDDQWPMVAGGVFVMLGAGATLLAAVRLVVGHEAAWRFLSLGSVVALAVGLAAQVPLSWALGGAVAEGVGDTRAAGRVALGLLFVAAVVAAAVTAILLDRASPRGHSPPPRGQVAPPRGQVAPPRGHELWTADFPPRV